MPARLREMLHQRRARGSVFLEPLDIERLAEHLGVTPQAFASRFTLSEYGEIELVKDEAGSCCFLEDGRCSVYEARPLQCRSYPFLPLDGFTPIESEYTWRYEKKVCPGIGKGRLYRKEEIIRIMRARDDVEGVD